MNEIVIKLCLGNGLDLAGETAYQSKSIKTVIKKRNELEGLQLDSRHVII